MPKWCSLLVSTVGLATVVVAVILIFVVIPPIIDDKITEQIVLENNTEQWQRFMKIPQPLTYKVYFFQILNPGEVEKNSSYPHVKEVGPYVYNVYSTKDEVQMRSNGEEIDFRNKLRFEFDAARSAPLTENDELLVLHLAMNSAFQVAEATGQAGMLELAVAGVFNKPKSMFLKTTPKLFLFDGVRFCADRNGITNIACNIIEEVGSKTIRKDPDNSLLFSFFNHKNHSDDGLWTINSGKKDIMKLGQISAWNNRNSTDLWSNGENTACNLVRGTDSTMYEPFRHGKEPNDFMWVYNSDICRTVSVHFKEKTEFKGIPTFRYEANNAFLADPADCYCIKQTKGIIQENNCLYPGALELNSCQKAPVVLTHPHFLHAHEEYKKTVKGLRYNDADKDLVTFIESEPYTGTPIKGSKRVQFNMFIYPIKGLKLTTNLPTALMPIIWVDEGIVLNQENINLLNENLFNNLLIVDAVTWTLVGVGAALFVGALLYYCCKSRQISTV